MKLTHDWIVIPHKTAKLDKLDPDALVELLVDWEAEHTEERGFVGVWDHPPLTRLMREIRIDWLQLVPPLKDEPTVSIVTPGFGAAIGPSLINDLAVEKATLKASALAGLQGERHLIILANYDYPTGVGLVLSDTAPPEEPPNLPNAITDLWISAVRHLIWHYSPQLGQWEIIETQTNARYENRINHRGPGSQVPYDSAREPL